MGFPHQRGNTLIDDILFHALLLVVLLWLCLTWYWLGPRCPTHDEPNNAQTSTAHTDVLQRPETVSWIDPQTSLCRP
jgi:hypothetical protein